MLTNKDYCDYETCVALKELGYPLISKEVRYEDKAVFVPGVLLYSAQKWLREEKKIDVMVQLDTKDIHLSSKYYSIYMSYMSRFRREFSYMFKNFDSFEEALSEGIKKAVKILQEE